MIFNMVSGGGLSLESIAVTTPPAKTQYAPGDEFDAAGMVVTANLGAGVTFPLTEYTVEPIEITLGMTYVTISGTVDGVTQTTTQAITVEDKTEIAYSGTMDSKEITVDGEEYVLYTLTGSGTLTVTGGAADADIWCCGGGANGRSVYTSAANRDGRGGGGGYFAQLDAQKLTAGAYVVTIGAAQGTTNLVKGEDTVLTAAGATDQNGGSGGGGFGICYSLRESATVTLLEPGTGCGLSSRPFSDSVNFTSLPCAGGGGGGDYDTYEIDGDVITDTRSKGGAGGSNGANGSAAEETSSNAAGAGGATGGGAGAKSGGYNVTGGAATYYGGGGGGHGARASSYGGRGGSGYQGVMFIRIKKEALKAS